MRFLVVFLADFKISLRMLADGAVLGCGFADYQMTAVAAFPHDHTGFLEENKPFFGGISNSSAAISNSSNKPAIWVCRIKALPRALP